MANKQSHIEGVHDQQVSDMHNAISTESPSAVLDAHILNAAKQGLEQVNLEQTNTGTIKNQRAPLKAYSIAASLCVSVLVVSMYLNNNFTPPQQSTNIDAPIELEKAFQVSPTNAESSNTNDSALEEIVVTGSRIRVQDSQEVDRLAIENVEIQRQEFQAARLAEAESIDAAAAERAQADVDSAIQARLRLIEDANVAQENAIAVFDAQELRDLSYRDNQNLWLQEIVRLQLSDLESDALLVEQEISLFTASYPEIEVESALTELE